MKTITVEFPIEEALELVRLARAESRCLIENGDVLPDIDVVKRAQMVLSARERIMTEIEEIANVEKKPAPLPEMGMDLTQPNRPQHPEIDKALAQATTQPEDSVEKMESLAVKHGVPAVAIGGDVEYDSLKHEDVLGRNGRPTLTGRDW